MCKCMELFHKRLWSELHDHNTLHLSPFRHQGYSSHHLHKSRRMNASNVTCKKCGVKCLPTSLLATNTVETRDQLIVQNLHTTQLLAEGCSWFHGYRLGNRIEASAHHVLIAYLTASHGIGRGPCGLGNYLCDMCLEFEAMRIALVKGKGFNRNQTSAVIRVRGGCLGGFIKLCVRALNPFYHSGCCRYIMWF